MRYMERCEDHNGFVVYIFDKIWLGKARGVEREQQQHSLIFLTAVG